MKRAVFDTTWFVDYYRGDKPAAALVEQIRQGEIDGFYSSVTVFELWVAPMSDDEEMTYRALMARMSEIALVGSAAHRAALWLRRSAPRYEEAVIRDALIAASAAEIEASIFTRNVRDFTRFYPNVEAY